MASNPASPSPSQGGNEPPLAKGPFFLFLLMMPAFIAVIVLMLVAMQYKQLRAFVSETPMPLATVPESPEAQEKALAKVRGFILRSIKEDRSPEPETLSLAADEINHLARSSRALMDLNLDYHLDLEDTLLVARNSLPATHLRGVLAFLAKVLRIKGYLNSEMKGYPDFRDGKIVLVPVSAVMNGQPAPVSVLDSKGPIDLREWVSDKDLYDRALAALAAVEIRGGRLLLIKKT